MHKNIHFVDKPGQATRKYRAGASQALAAVSPAVLAAAGPTVLSSLAQGGGKTSIIALTGAGWLAGWLALY